MVLEKIRGNQPVLGTRTRAPGKPLFAASRSLHLAPLVLKLRMSHPSQLAPNGAQTPDVPSVVLACGPLNSKAFDARIPAIRLSQKKETLSRLFQMMNRNAIQATNTISAEYFSPATTRPSPMMPAASPEKNPWISAAWQKSRL